MKLFFSVFLVVVFISGCSSNPYVIHDYDKSHHSAKSVSIIPGEIRTFMACNPTIPNDCGTSQDNYHFGTVEALQEAGIFKSVELGNHETDLSIYLKLKAEDETLSFGGFLKLLLSACTAFLLPVPYEYSFDITYDVYRGNESLGKFEYRRSSTEFVSHFGNLGRDLQKHAAKSIATEFIKDAQSKGVL